MEKLSAAVLPSAVIIIILYGIFKGVNVFDSFIEGSKKGISTFVSLIPSILALILMVGMLSSSGALNVISKALSPVTKILGIPEEVTPLCLLSPLSGSGSLTMFEKILESCGPDSMAGRVASVIAGSTETTFYAIAVYYGAVGIRKTRYTVVAGLCADMTSFIVSSLTIKLLFG